MILRILEIKVFLCLMSTQYVRGQEGTLRYAEKMLSDLDYPIQLNYGRMKHYENNVDDDSSDYGNYNREQFFEHSPKRSSLQNMFPAASGKVQQMEANRGTIIPYYLTSNSVGCSCQLKPTLVDLGHDYYPRYIRSGICSTGSCSGNHRCSYINYRLRVLKKRNSEFKEFTEKHELPETLQKHWIADNVNVVVACQCS